MEAYQVVRSMEQVSRIPSTFGEEPFAALVEGLKSEDKNIKHPLDAFDFVYETYSRSDKDLLIEWLSSAFDRDYLISLSQFQLAEMYSGGIAEHMWQDIVTGQTKLSS